MSLRFLENEDRLFTLPLPQHRVLLTGQSSPQTSSKRVLRWAGALYELVKHVSVSWCSPSGADCSSVAPLQDHKSCQKTCSSLDSSLHGANGPARSLL